MGDQPRLGDTYDDVIAHAVTHLLQVYNGTELAAVEPKSTRWVALDISCAGRLVTIELGLSPCFPDEFPKVKVREHSALRMPHLNRYGVLCLFDDELAVPNPDRPTELLDAIVERATRLVEAGLSGANRRDYIDEFESYWSETTAEQWLSLIEVGDKAKEVVALKFTEAGREKVLLADSVELGQQWLANLGFALSSKTAALFLPIESLGVPPFPDTNGQLLGRLMTHSPASVYHLINFLNKHRRPTIIVACIGQRSANGSGTLLAWQHSEVSSSQSGRKRRRSALDELRMSGKNRTITKVNVVRVDATRLHYRGGDGKLSPATALVIGCGSVGSHLAKMITDAGVNRLTLVDPDILSYENVARHLCGLSSVGKLKVSALKEHLVSHSPSITCNSEPVSVLHLLRRSPHALNNQNVALVAVARYPVERRLSELAAASQVTTPLMFVWVEPFMAGGHAFWQPPGTAGCFKCLFRSDGSFKYQVLRNPQQYLRREAGCRTTFAPYAVLEVKRFISDLSFFVQDAIAGNLKGPTLFTWLGSITGHRAAKRNVHSMWAGADDYSARRTPISSAWYCEDCRD